MHWAVCHAYWWRISSCLTPTWLQASAGPAERCTELPGSLHKTTPALGEDLLLHQGMWIVQVQGLQEGAMSCLARLLEAMPGLAAAVHSALAAQHGQAGHLFFVQGEPLKTSTSISFMRQAGSQ